jgi:hypothetical protein
VIPLPTDRQLPLLDWFRLLQMLQEELFPEYPGWQIEQPPVIGLYTWQLGTEV